MKSIKLFSITLLLLIAMLFIWNSCTKQEAANPNDKKYTLENFEKAIFEAEKKYQHNTSELELRSITSCFIPDTIECYGDFLFLGRDSAIVNVYNNCKAKIEYDLYRCWEAYDDPYGQPVVIFTYYFDNFTAVPIEGECDSVILLWNELIENGEWDEFLESSETFLRDAQKATELYVVNDFFSYVGGFFKCSYLNSTLTSEFYIANCYQVYLKSWLKGGVFGYDVETVQCGESCCKSTTLYCVKQDGSTHVSDPFIEQVGDCEPVLNAGNPGIGFFPIGDCDHECE